MYCNSVDMANDHFQQDNIGPTLSDEDEKDERLYGTSLVANTASH